MKHLLPACSIGFALFGVVACTATVIDKQKQSTVDKALATQTEINIKFCNNAGFESYTEMHTMITFKCNSGIPMSIIK